MPISARPRTIEDRWLHSVPPPSQWWNSPGLDHQSQEGAGAGEHIGISMDTMERNAENPVASFWMQSLVAGPARGDICLGCVNKARTGIPDGFVAGDAEGRSMAVYALLVRTAATPFVVSTVIDANTMEILAAGLPVTVMLESLGDARLRVKEPIEVAVFAEGGQVIATAAGLDEFGFGDDLPDAIKDLQSALTDLYFTLEEEQGHLGKGLRRVWGVLQDKVELQ